ncbi:MAG: prefoldin subunit [Candidatus Marsarchaeota archaeon]|nr:prefoldin subunit [Candidatus Marsarchaeota archaeon]
MERDQLEKLTMNYQKMQEQLQNIAMQKQQYEAQKQEYKQAEEEIGKASGKVYSTIGGVIIETTKEEALSTIKEKKEFVEMRLNLISKQGDELSKKEAEMRAQINEAIKGFQEK